MPMTENMPNLIREITQTLTAVSTKELEDLAEKILASKRIFTAGAGRSGLMMKAFAMRLMHLGIPVYVIGETTTPGITAGDLLIIGSGSGETGSLVVIATKALSAEAGLAAITAIPASTLGKKAGVVVVIPAPTPKSAQSGQYVSMQPMGSLFEQCLLLTLDVLVLRLMEKLSSCSDTMFTRHANLE